MEVVDPAFMTDLKRRDAVHTEGFVDQEQGVHQLHLFPIGHFMKLPGCRKTVGEVSADADDGCLIDAVNIQRHTVGLLDGQRLQDPLFSIHMAAVLIKIALSGSHR